MNIGVAWDQTAPGCNYRACDPLRALEQRPRHSVVWPQTEDQGALDAGRVGGCDMVHVYRRADRETFVAMRELAAQGVPTTWDTDDDLSAVPEESPTYRRTGGERGERKFRASLRIAKLATVVTVTTDTLADRYREAGVEHVVVIPNYLSERPRPRQQHEGVVVGWVAGVEHQADAVRLGIGETLQQLQARHPQVRIECIGVDLGLPRSDIPRFVPFAALPRRMSGWDIGIAPLADLPFNRARSDIKIKEYAASGLAWLASPLAPYRHLGETQGGRLVPDDQWLDALDELVRDTPARDTLRRNALAWAETQFIDDALGAWEAVFDEARARAAHGSHR